VKDAVAKSSANNSPSIHNPFITVEYVPSVERNSGIYLMIMLNKYGLKPQP
jgi:hypothetical protein